MKIEGEKEEVISMCMCKVDLGDKKKFVIKFIQKKKKNKNAFNQLKILLCEKQKHESIPISLIVTIINNE